MAKPWSSSPSPRSPLRSSSARSSATRSQPELVGRIAEASGGNPLFVEELLRAWAGSGLLDTHEDRWVLARAVGDVELPSTVQSIYAAQLDDLPPAARSVVRRASVAGRQFPTAALEALGSDGDEGSTCSRGAGSSDADRGSGARAVVRVPARAPARRRLREPRPRRAGSAPRAHGTLARGEGPRAACRDRRGDGPALRAALTAAPTLARDLGDGLTRGEAAVLAPHGSSGQGTRPSERPPTTLQRGSSVARSSSQKTVRRDGVRRGSSASRRRPRSRRTWTRDCRRPRRHSLCLVQRRWRSRATQSCATSCRVRLPSSARSTRSSSGSRRCWPSRTTRSTQLRDRGDAPTARVLLTRVMGAAMIGDEAWEAVAADRARVLELAAALDDPELELERVSAGGVRRGGPRSLASCRAARNPVSDAGRTWPRPGARSPVSACRTIRSAR